MPNQHSETASVFWVGEMPDPHDVIRGFPFSNANKAGGVLQEEALAPMGLTRQEISLGHAQLCAFPGEDSGAKERQKAAVKRLRDKRAKEIADTLKSKGIKASVANKSGKEQAAQEILDPFECCKPALEYEMFSYPYVVAMGTAASHWVAGTTTGIMNLHGDLLEVEVISDYQEYVREFWPEDLYHETEDGRKIPYRKVVPVYHPSYVQRAPASVHRWRAGLLKGYRWINDALYWPSFNIVCTQPSVKELHDFLYGPGWEDEEYWVLDYETSGIDVETAEVRCLAISVPDLTADGTPALIDRDKAIVRPAQVIGIHIVQVGGGTGGLKVEVGAQPGRYYSWESEEAIKELLRKASSDRVWVGHNAGSYDNKVHKRWLGVEIG